MPSNRSVSPDAALRIHASRWRMTWRTCAFALIGVASVCDAGSWDVISWAGNTPDWNQKLGVSELRQGCSSAPPGCMQAVDKSAVAGGVAQITLAITPDPDKIAAYALEYSAASLNEHRLRGIGLDDALSVFLQWQKQGHDPGTLLAEVITNTKAKNSGLEFGITLYEDQLANSVLRGLPANVRAAVDRVHFYIHYRKDGPRFGDYVQQVKQLFPNAAVVAGVYPYDRVDYLPCSITAKAPCTLAEEKQLYEKTLRLQASMMVRGDVAAIEFYPGNFGTEDSWVGWQRSNICQAPRVQSCTKTTKEMQATTQQVLDSIRSERHTP